MKKSYMFVSFSEKCPTIIVSFFLRPQSSPCMYLFLVQTLIALGGTQRSRFLVPASARNFFVHLRNRTRLKVPPFNFFGTFFRISFCLEFLFCFPSFFDILLKLEFQKLKVSPILHFSSLLDCFKILIFRLNLGCLNIYKQIIFF